MTICIRHVNKTKRWCRQEEKNKKKKDYRKIEWTVNIWIEEKKKRTKQSRTDSNAEMMHVSKNYIKKKKTKILPDSWEKKKQNSGQWLDKGMIWGGEKRWRSAVFFPPYPEDEWNQDWKKGKKMPETNKKKKEISKTE